MSFTENTNEVIMQKNIEELLLSPFIKDIEGDTMMAFSGVMSQEAIVGLGEVLRSELHHYHPLNIVNKIFAVYVEMTQNVLHYSQDRSDSNGKSIGKGSVFIFRHMKAYSLVTINLVNEKQHDYLRNKCKLVNSFNEEEIKGHYLNRRKRQAEGDSKGAGLGFIDIIRRSGNPIQYKFDVFDSQLHYFFLSSKINIEY